MTWRCRFQKFNDGPTPDQLLIAGRSVADANSPLLGKSRRGLLNERRRFQCVLVVQVRGSGAYRFLEVAGPPHLLLAREGYAVGISFPYSLVYASWITW